MLNTAPSVYWLAQAADASSSWKLTVPIAALGLAMVGLVLLSRRTRRRAGAPRPTTQELVERSRQVQGVHGDLERIMVEIEQMAKRMSAHLDAKSLRLEQLLNEADRKIQSLQSLAKTPVRTEVPPSAAEPHAQSEAPVPDDPLARSVYTLADQGLTSQQIAQRLGEHAGKVELILALRSVR